MYRGIEIGQLSTYHLCRSVRENVVSLQQLSSLLSATSLNSGSKFILEEAELSLTGK
ncbi:hypothetical protein OH492_25525 [Vibrio chagasii]|nr:hypothetical protein [Vibrio chagasii]